MAPEGPQPSYSRRRGEEAERKPEEGRSLRTTPLYVETPMCGARSRMTANPPAPLTTNAAGMIEGQAFKAETTGKRASSASPISCALSAYCYSPLPEGHIRLLRLMPHREERAPIQCQLFDYPLLNSGKGTHLYEALSYTWGSSKNPQSIRIDNGYILVTPNLHVALKRLRDCSLERIVWVDAICINQNDKEEKGQQVQSMVEIYAKASRVVVWLEEATADSGKVYGGATTDSDGALEKLSVVAHVQPTKSLDDETNQQAMGLLLQRSWLQRIWVLQEVAAARHVLIMCHSADIDGYAFFSRLNKSTLASQDPETQSLIPSVAYLIKDAIFRPKSATSRLNRFSLDIRPLGELMDMYHNRKATDRRDKVYALLGMSSDDDIPDDLSPNYKILWKELFCRLVKFLLGEQATVETWEEKEIAVIRSKGCILGEVSTGDSDVCITSKYTPGYLGQKNWSWAQHATAKSIRKGDVVCQLQGASKPTIIRLYDDYCAVIAIAVTPTDDKRIVGLDIDRPGVLPLAFPHDFLLVWDWEESWDMPGDGVYESLMSRRVPKEAKAELESYLDKAASLRNMGLMLGDWQKYEEAEEKLQKAINAHKRASGKELSHTVEAMDNLARMYGGGDWKKAKKLGEMADLLQRRGDYTQITDGVMIRMAGSFCQELMTLLLDWREDEVQITEGVVKAAAGNEWNGKEVMALLLDRRGSEVKITEGVVKAAAANGGSGKEVMALLLDQRGDEITITEEWPRQRQHAAKTAT
ncbi:hypothetical protein FoTM2_013554 [Fusarium oxysporum f. sp. vasinfectum]|uniref:Heterokaryon incompatibility domain-containing protein n=1 Tax=Fusarium oxysporum f. sp. vasinfectum 25433 TaxID=1089449 RepID=X0KL88_FUSOX|nr:hypothetical protein FOTG_17306 [Fusarium oxysporum f. sp. vasinfectum 25433]KAK2468820.1 hypothetical protein H9L39_19582 [Fusarium oxysporum f. sp. albedinis]KAK2926685.1 hypothetical protein FoTM2_013554 [Fusarium oxysporum f. sp. vasinfectum]